ncbi:MAG: acyl-CoA dehydrogenase family protein [Phycisphaerae bacterium]|nr:acyl-CoA dehydrogenase family protein [Phycisphaerae bacterium]
MADTGNGGVIPFGYDLDEDHEMIRDSVREFAREVVAPGAMDRDIKGEFPAEIIRQLGEMGYQSISVPEEYGGPGLDALASAIIVEELSYADASVGVINSVQNSLCIDPILAYGTEEQRKKWLPPMTTGECLNCFSLTEPGSGSDAGAMKCRAELKGDEWVINGTKLFVTTGAEANLIVLFVRTEEGDKRNASCLIVPKDTPGVEVGKHEDKLGIRGSSTTELIFEDARVPAENLLGERGAGLRIAMMAIDGGRIGIGAQAIGIAQAALDKAIDYALERKQFGKTISHFQAVQWKIADMATRIVASRALLYKACWTKDQKKHSLHIPAMVKVFAAETATFCANEAIQIFGGMGYCRESEVERYLRDAKITEIYEGTSEMQRMTIGATLAKDPERVAAV